MINAPTYDIAFDWPSLVAPRFLPYMANRDRYLILWGGRGSGKSDFAVKKIIKRCLEESYFRCILVRNTYNSIKDSQYQNLKDNIIEMGLSDLFAFKESPLEIRCLNGNRILARGCDDPTKLKSIKDPCCVWYEEDIISADDFTTITGSVRAPLAAYVQEMFTINPEVEGDYKQHWFWQRFFAGNYPDKTFRTTISIDVEGRSIEQSATVVHSTWKDNPLLPDENKALYQSYAHTSPYHYQIHTLGEWGTKDISDRFYPDFSQATHVVPSDYDPDLALHISFDFNTKPHNTLTVWQFDGDTGTQIDEFCFTPPRNRDEDQVKAFLAKYGRHSTKLYVYGDPSGRADDTSKTYGDNKYTRILGWLSSLPTELRVFAKAPSVDARGTWLGAVLQESQPVKMRIADRCTTTISDYLNLRSDPAGGKLKDLVKGVQPYGHCSDANEYLLCWVWAEHFAAYRNRGLPTAKVQRTKTVQRVGY